MNMNLFVIGGHCGRDAEAKTDNFATFSIAYNQKQKGKPDTTLWVEVLCFGNLSKFATQHVKKGRAFVVAGKFQLNQYVKKDGTTGASVQVIANEINFADSKPQQEALPQMGLPPESRNFDDMPF